VHTSATVAQSITKQPKGTQRQKLHNVQLGCYRVPTVGCPVRLRISHCLERPCRFIGVCRSVSTVLDVAARCGGFRAVRQGNGEVPLHSLVSDLRPVHLDRFCSCSVHRDLRAPLVTATPAQKPPSCLRGRAGPGRNRRHGRGSLACSVMLAGYLRAGRAAQPARPVCTGSALSALSLASEGTLF
jgi:hypothetical protein